MLDHLFGGVEIGDHAFAHRPDRLDRAGGAAEHQLGILAHREHLLLAVLDMIGHDRGFVQHDALAPHIDERVRGSEVDRHVLRKQPAKSQHDRFTP